jgi:large subunit ribosomal protein L18
MKNLKLKARQRRARKTRGKQRSLMTIKLAVHRTGKHIYAQIIKPGIVAVTGQFDQVLASASTLDIELRKSLNQSSNKDAASQVGSLIAKRAKEQGISKVAFDRSGYRYHGRVKALADAARENGLEI